MNRRLTVLTRQRDGWFTRADALDAGYSDSEIRLRLRMGQWLQLCRDTYVEPAGWPDDEPPWDRTRRLHTLMARAVLLRMGDGVAIGHQSATILRRLIVEFDGAQKYGSGGADVVLAEKWREDRLRELGYAFVRVAWADLDHPRDVGDRLRKALVHARVA